MTSAQYSVSENPPIYFCGLETEVQLASYHRVQTVVKHFDGDLMLCGDTLFAGSMGRTDLPGGDEDTIFASLRRLASLPGNYKVLPGHGDSSTLEGERRTNFYMRQARCK